jgi:hypothetical protein
MPNVAFFKRLLHGQKAREDSRGLRIDFLVSACKLRGDMKYIKLSIKLLKYSPIAFLLSLTKEILYNNYQHLLYSYFLCWQCYDLRLNVVLLCLGLVLISELVFAFICMGITIKIFRFFIIPLRAKRQMQQVAKAFYGETTLGSADETVKNQFLALLLELRPKTPLDFLVKTRKTLYEWLDTVGSDKYTALAFLEAVSLHLEQKEIVHSASIQNRLRSWAAGRRAGKDGEVRQRAERLLTMLLQSEDSTLLRASSEEPREVLLRGVSSAQTHSELLKPYDNTAIAVSSSPEQGCMREEDMGKEASHAENRSELRPTK